MTASVAADQLRLFIERIERLEADKKDIGDDIKDVYLEAKATGYDVKALRQIVRLRKMDPHDRQEAEAVLETYKSALGMDDMFAGHDGGRAPRSVKGARASYAEHLQEMDAKGIGVSVTVAGGAEMPLNETARRRRKGKAAVEGADGGGH